MSKPQHVEAIGDRVAQARRRFAVLARRDIPPAELARMIGASVSTITRLEAGERQPGEDLVQKIATALGVSPAWLRYGVEEQGVAPSGAKQSKGATPDLEGGAVVPAPKRSAAVPEKKRRQA